MSLAAPSAAGPGLPLRAPYRHAGQQAPCTPTSSVRGRNQQHGDTCRPRGVGEEFSSNCRIALSGDQGGALTRAAAGVLKEDGCRRRACCPWLARRRASRSNADGVATRSPSPPSYQTRLPTSDFRGHCGVTRAFILTPLSALLFCPGPASAFGPAARPSLNASAGCALRRRPDRRRPRVGAHETRTSAAGRRGSRLDRR
jgi:hypothetical protein